MKITVWGINYAPELTGIGPYNTALCEFLAARGHLVRMVTGFSYYPAWRKDRRDRFRIYRSEAIRDVRVHRCWLYVPGRVTILRRIFHEASFVFTSLWRQFSLPRPDLIVVISPPLLLGWAAWIYSRYAKAPFVFHVQDLQPDAAAGLKMLRPGFLMRLLFGLEQLAYRKSVAVSGISRGLCEAFSRKGVALERQVYFPNFVTLPPPGGSADAEGSGRFRHRHGFAPDDFLAVYSGNIGLKQGLDILLGAARQVANDRIRLVICGDGSQRDRMARELASTPNPRVVLLPLQSAAGYVEMLADADVCLITQQPGAGACFFPSKLLTTLAHGKPVLTVADEESELARAVEANGLGVNIANYEPEAVAAELDALAADAGRLERYAEAGRQFVRRFEATKVLEEFERRLYAIKGLEIPAAAPAFRPAKAA